MQDHLPEFGVQGAWRVSAGTWPQVVTSPDASPAVLHAAELLRGYLRQILAVDPSATPDASRRIALVLEPSLGVEAYAFALRGQSLEIRGGCVLGVAFGVFAFLRDACGCIFAGPHPDDEFIPTYGAMTFRPVEQVHRPAQAYRGLMFTTREPVAAECLRLDWMLKNGMNHVMYRLAPAGQGGDEVDPHTGQRHGVMSSEGPRMSAAWFDDHLLPEINRRGLKLDFSHHNLGFWLPPEKHLTDHPEWFALRNGARGGSGHQLLICTSSREAVAAVIAAMRDYLRTHPTHRRIGLIPEDGMGMCECEACVAQDQEQDATRRPWRGHLDPASINLPKSRRYARLLNDVATALAPEFPDVTLVGGAYVDLQWPAPDIELHPNVAMWLAVYWRDGARSLGAASTSPINAFFYDLIAQWQARLGSRLYLYEYYMGMNAQHSLPWPTSAVICEDWANLRRLPSAAGDKVGGVGGAATQCLTSLHDAYGLNLFAYAAIASSDRATGAGIDDHDRLFAAYLRGMFGYAADAVRPVYQAWLDAVAAVAAGEADDHPLLEAGLLKPDCLNIVWLMRDLPASRVDQILKAARTAAVTPRERRQVERLACYLDYCERARHLIDVLHVQQCQDATAYQANAAAALESLLASMRNPHLEGWIAPAHATRWRTHVRRAIASRTESQPPAASAPR